MAHLAFPTIFFYGVDVRGSLKIANQFSEFTDGKLSVPYVSHQVMHTSSPKAGNVEPREDCRIVDVEMRAAPGLDAKQFTLSAFDLPEPGEVRGAKPWLFWITLTALLLCISLSVYRRWRKVHGVA